MPMFKYFSLIAAVSWFACQAAGARDEVVPIDPNPESAGTLVQGEEVVEEPTPAPTENPGDLSPVSPEGVTGPEEVKEMAEGEIASETLADIPDEVSEESEHMEVHNPEDSDDLIPLPQDLQDIEPLPDLPPGDDFMEDSLLLMPDDFSAPFDTGFADLPGDVMGEPARIIERRYKTLRIKTDKDPEVVSLAQQAAEAKSDEARRQAKRAYYRLLFEKMRKADESLTAKIDRMERAYLERLEQTRIEPTIPLSPPPTPQPLRTPEA
jgi:hypothetical protein